MSSRTETDHAVGACLALSEFRIVRRRPVPVSRLPRVSLVVAIRPVRAAEEAAVPAHSGDQPAAADGTGLDGPVAVAAAVGAAGPDRQSLSAIRTRTCRVLAQGKVRAAVKDASVASVFPALQPPPGASRTAHVIFRRPAEDGDIESAVDRFAHER